MRERGAMEFCDERFGSRGHQHTLMISPPNNSRTGIKTITHAVFSRQIDLKGTLWPNDQATRVITGLRGEGLFRDRNRARMVMIEIEQEWLDQGQAIVSSLGGKGVADHAFYAVAAFIHLYCEWFPTQEFFQANLDATKGFCSQRFFSISNALDWKRPINCIGRSKVKRVGRGIAAWAMVEVLALVAPPPLLRIFPDLHCIDLLLTTLAIGEWCKVQVRGTIPLPPGYKVPAISTLWTRPEKHRIEIDLLIFIAQIFIQVGPCFAPCLVLRPETNINYIF